MVIPVHHGNGITRLDADRLEPGGQSSDAFTQLPITETSIQATDNLLVLVTGHRRMPELLDQQWIRIGGGCMGLLHGCLL